MPEVNTLALIHAHHRHGIIQQRMAAAETAAQDAKAADFVAAYDADTSGGLTQAEAEGTLLGRVLDDAGWSAADADADGELSAAEIEAHHATMMAARSEWSPAAQAILNRTAEDA